MKCILSWMYSNFGQIGPQTSELVALEHLKISPFGNNGENGVSTFLGLFTYLRTIQNILMTILAGSQVSDRCPFGNLFFFFLSRLIVS